MEVKKLGVLGAGAMGHGIAQLAAVIGCEVVLRDIDMKFVEKGIAGMDKFMSRSVEKGKMSAEDKEAALARVKGTVNMSDLSDVDFVVEAVLEDLDLKKKVFAELDEVCRPDVILATNTSSMSITEIAKATKRPNQVVGMHFFNPAPIMRLVEVIRGYFTDDETVAATSALAQRMGKQTVEVKVDSPGFIVNRLMVPHMLEAIEMYQEGVASKEDIDKAVKLGLNYPMGPFELMDMTGIDIIYNVAEYFLKELNKELKWVSPTLLKNTVRAGRLGKKTGGGWYE
ncbi:MAG: 3-hydroxybutyryl-CoA dehydrogenase [Proteobacteria bacterium]|nr:3-hydroxybutyryl-CoA dehydrogenase [Pseudomonadota bacterium]